MKKQGFIKGSAILLGMVMITKALGLIYKIPLTNILGGTGMGYFSAVFSVFTPAAALVSAGIPSSVARMTAENHALARYANLRKLRRSAHLAFGALSLAACLLLLLLSAPLSAHVIREPAVRYAIIAIAPSVVFSSFAAVERGYYEGLRNMVPTAASETSEAMLRLIFGLLLAHKAAAQAERSFALSGEVFGLPCATAAQAADTALPFITAAAILGTTLASALTSLLMFLYSRLTKDGITEEMLRSDPVTDSTLRQVTSVTKLSLTMSITAVISTLMTMLDMVVITPCIRAAASKDPAAFSALTDLNVSIKELPHFLYGSYQGLAVLLYGLVPTLTAMLGRSSLSQLAEHRAKGRDRAFASGLYRMLTVSGLIAAPGGLALAFLSRPILSIVFPGRVAELTAAARPLMLLGFSAVFYALTLPCSTVLQALGKPVKAAAIMVAGGVFRLLLELVLIPIPTVNILGAAAAELCSSAFVCVLTLRETLKLTRARPSIVECFIKPAYTGLMFAFSTRLCFDFLTDRVPIPEIAAFLLAAVFGGIMYFISLLLLCEMPKSLKSRIILKKM